MSTTRKPWLLLPLLLLLSLAFGCVTQGAPTLEEQAQAIDSRLMCPVCPAETIDQSQATIAKQMRQLVREKLAAGETRDEILAYFVERYGENILAAPKKSGLSLLAWGMPVVGIVLGLGVVVLVVRRMRKLTGQESQGTSATAGSGDNELAPYLAMVDEDLRRLLGKGYAPPDSTAAK